MLDNAEIRAIRGSLSRGAFAHALGVTSLTVLRWELPEGNKESRRPRPKMVQALRQFATHRDPPAPTPTGSGAQPAGTLLERLLTARARLACVSTRGELLRQLTEVIRETFPGREPVLGGAELTDAQSVVPAATDEGLVYFGVRGALSAEERAALLLVAGFVSRPWATAAAVVEEPAPESPPDDVLPELVAVSAAMRELKAEIVRLSRSNATVLLTGESGSGKEVVARAVHEVSSRSGQPLVALNCASVPRDLFESQLFGYRKGAFSGACSDSPGVIRAAEGGSVFLDEIGELPLELQPKLLRFLENSEVFTLGEQKPRRVDVRVIAATHRNLETLVQEGRFREDLYYRLNVVSLRVPALRERREDLAALARMFLSRSMTQGSTPPTLANDALEALAQHPWPGNVRELRNVIERVMAYTPVPAVLTAKQLRI
jgi:Sigma-54 interaction domain